MILNLHSVEIVDFETIIFTLNYSEDKIMCLIVKPKSGNSNLCEYFAYLDDPHQPKNYHYVISGVAQTRGNEARRECTIDEEFILSWLSLSMSLAANRVNSSPGT